MEEDPVIYPQKSTIPHIIKEDKENKEENMETEEYKALKNGSQQLIP